MRRFENRVVLVTGAAGGIGRAIVARLAAEGAIVVANDLREALVEGAASFAAGSVVEDAQAIVDTAAAAHGRLDVLVNNAGVTRDAPLHRMSDEDWRLVHDVGLYGAFAMTRAAADLLRAPADHHRKVVSMSSNVALHGAPGTVNYSAAKAGVIGFTRALAREWARRRVNVNAVAPGLISGTALTEAKPPELIARVQEQIPLGRAGTPEDVAAAVAFLASVDSDFMTGQVLELSGGLEVPA